MATRKIQPTSFSPVTDKFYPNAPREFGKQGTGFVVYTFCPGIGPQSLSDKPYGTPAEAAKAYNAKGMYGDKITGILDVHTGVKVDITV